MSNKIIKMNRKGQYYPRPSYRTVHPVLIIGILIFILPFMFPIIGMSSAPRWLDKVLNFTGLFVILIGAALSIYKASN